MMKNQFIKLLIVLISIALLGLIGIQIYWIDNAVTLREDEFNKTVNTALNNVVNKLERVEMINKVTTSRLGRQFILNRSQSVKDRILQLQKLHTMKSDTIVKDGPDGSKVKIIRNSSADSSEHFDEQIRIENGDKEYTSSYSLDVSLNGNQKTTINHSEYDTVGVDGKVVSQTNLIYDIVSDLFRFNFKPRIDQRVSPKNLDSLISYELNRGLIKTNYESGVFDFYGRGIAKYTEEENIKALQESTYKVRLYPNDIVGDPYYLSLYFPSRKSYLLKTMSSMLSLSVFFMLAIIAAFSYTINSMVKQKKLSLIKNDFINNMTHELKTPISTISLACQALTDKEISANKTQKEKFVRMIEQENKRLGLLVENVLKSSIWDKRDFNLEQEEIDVNKIVQEVSENSSLQIEKRKGELITNLLANPSIIIGDGVHITNIIYNLIDNANKYSFDTPKVEVTTYSNENEVVISVSDKGQGISKEHQKKIFDKFYRIPTGNVHDVKGFGLGLNYVQAVVIKHGGRIELESAVGKGSKFDIHLPFKSKDELNRTANEHV